MTDESEPLRRRRPEGHHDGAETGRSGGTATAHTSPESGEHGPIPGDRTARKGAAGPLD
jgi:hypothetical protein